jgi:hypothetical protein
MGQDEQEDMTVYKVVVNTKNSIRSGLLIAKIHWDGRTRARPA